MRRLALSLPFLFVLATGLSAQDGTVAPKPAGPPAKAGKALSRTPKLDRTKAVKAPASAADVTTAGGSASSDPVPATTSPGETPLPDPALRPTTAPPDGKKAVGAKGKKEKAAAAPVDPAVAAAASEAAAKKAQQATEARNKAWDVKMQKLMTGICRGC